MDSEIKVKVLSCSSVNLLCNITLRKDFALIIHLILRGYIDFLKYKYGFDFANNGITLLVLQEYPCDVFTLKSVRVSLSY